MSHAIPHCAGVRGLYDGITGTWMRQMSYSLCRFWAYDESKKIVGAGAFLFDLDDFLSSFPLAYNKTIAN
jgi:hypothetical protein